MQTEINTEKFGTTGLPKFGGGAGYAGYTPGAEVSGTTGEAVAEVNAAFNNLLGVVKKHCIAGNNMALWYFGFALKGIYGLALSVVAEKPVTNA